MPRYTEDENGYITIPNNPISKSGVFQYKGENISPLLKPEKIYNVWRPEAELNNPDTIKSFSLMPWIPEHVMLGAGFTPAEVVGVQGITGEVVQYIGDTLYSNLKLFGDDLKKLIKAGLKELSCGFRCTWEVVSGTSPDGQHYDAIQRNIRGNHLASVESARMGSDVRVQMDRALFALDSIDYNQKPNGETMDEKLLAAAIATALKPMQQAMDGMAKDMEDVKKKAEDMPDFIKKKIEGKEKSAEDMEEEEKAKDMEAKKAKDMKEKSDAMDARIEKLESTAMDGGALMKAFAAKQTLAGQVSQIVGAFDHSDMDVNGVAKYGLEKMGVACDSGQELAMLKGILHARTAPTYTVDHGNAQDQAAKTSDALDKAGI